MRWLKGIPRRGRRTEGSLRPAGSVVRRRLQYNRSVTETELTGLQRTILEVEALGLPPRESMRLVNARVGFFVGQQRYKEELERARELIGADQPEAAEATG